MDRALLIACLALLVFVEVQSYTLRDVLRERLRERELNRLRQSDQPMFSSNRMYDARKYEELNRFRQSDQPMFSSHPLYDTRLLKAINDLREFHLKRMLDEGKSEPDCEDYHPHCDWAKDEGTCEYLYTTLTTPYAKAAKHIAKDLCRFTCNADNCADKIGPSEVKPTKPPAPGINCVNEMQDKDCEDYANDCKEEERYAYHRHIWEYCSKTCNRVVYNLCKN